METLHRLKFSKNNSWAEPLAAPRSPEGSFPSSGLRGGQAPGPVDRAHPGSQPARPRPALWGEEPFGNLRAPPLPWPRTSRAEAEVGGAHGCGLRGSG